MSSSKPGGVLDEPGSTPSDGATREDLESDGSAPFRVDDESTTCQYDEYDDGGSTNLAPRPGCRRPSRLATLSGVVLLVVFLTAFGLTATLYRKGRHVTKVHSANEYYAGNRRSPIVSEPVRTPKDGGWHDLEEDERTSLEADLKEGEWESSLLPLLQLDDDLSLPTSTSTSPSLEEAKCPRGYEPRSARRNRRRQGRRGLLLATKSVKSRPTSEWRSRPSGGDSDQHVPEHCVRVDDTGSTGRTEFQTKAGKKEGKSKGSNMGTVPIKL
ncbi:hypothetical protein THAOC_17310 [Thalassiosira oceanica]|uniref:Uncharacterized protein n=1 Tax=Thalassiosira oceanica TaxID=159749 RepID=K0SMD7_THAOC|nr:hypothetical protein THAOC_17310 [Thalassiosira oceanica]|eukprot:EJK62091.1 hypothetical protein THAOC_17310 [Thalassiosira oceanica]